MMTLYGDRSQLKRTSCVPYVVILFLAVLSLIMMTKLRKEAAVATQTPKRNVPKQPFADSYTKNNRASILDNNYLMTEESSTPQFSILPKRVYTVIGLESSGTHFVSEMIRGALAISKTRSGSHEYGKQDAERENDETQVQHFSLPWGRACHYIPDLPIVDVVFPAQCSRKSKKETWTQCLAMKNDVLDKNIDIDYERNRLRYPKRYFLNITSHKDWYDLHGVETWFIIVVRDTTISSSARLSVHCKDELLRDKEDEVGKTIIKEVIRKYIQGKDVYRQKDVMATDENGRRQLGIYYLLVFV